jgi:hypothetical protein
MLRLLLVALPLVVASPFEVRSPPESRPLRPAATRDQHHSPATHTTPHARHPPTAHITTQWNYNSGKTIHPTIYFVINLFRAQGYQPTIRRCALQPGRPPRMRPSSRACRRPDTRDRGVDVAPAGRGGDVDDAVAVEPDRSQLRLLAPGSNAQAISKTGEAACTHVPMASASCIAPRRARSLPTESGRRKRTARVRTHGLARMRSAACAPASRAQRQGRPKLCRLAQAARSLCL